MENTPTPPSGELLDEVMRARLEVEFEEFLERDLKSSKKKDDERLKDTYGGDEEKMRADRQRMRKEYREQFANASEFEKLWNIMNNFHTWLPKIGFVRREGLDEKGAALRKDIDEYVSNMSDEALRLLRYDFRNEEKRHQWLAAIFPIYCAMRDKGHDAELLWR